MFLKKKCRKQHLFLIYGFLAWSMQIQKTKNYSVIIIWFNFMEPLQFQQDLCSIFHLLSITATIQINLAIGCKPIIQQLYLQHHTFIHVWFIWSLLSFWKQLLVCHFFSTYLLRTRFSSLFLAITTSRLCKSSYFHAMTILHQG